MLKDNTNLDTPRSMFSWTLNGLFGFNHHFNKAGTVFVVPGLLLIIIIIIILFICIAPFIQVQSKVLYIDISHKMYITQNYYYYDYYF